MIDTAALRKVAGRATKGTWKVWGMQVRADQDGSNHYDRSVPVADTHATGEQGKPRTWDATYIATFDPPMVLALLDRIDQLERSSS